MGLLTWILVGLVAGLIAKLVLGEGLGGVGIQGLALTVLLGVGGALVGGFIASAMGWGEITGFNVRTLFIATLGAVGVIVVFRALSSRRSGRGLT